MGATYFQIAEERHVVHERHCVEHVEASILCDYECVTDKLLKTLREATASFRIWLERDFSRVVEEIRSIE